MRNGVAELVGVVLGVIFIGGLNLHEAVLPFSAHFSKLTTGKINSDVHRPISFSTKTPTSTHLQQVQ